MELILSDVKNKIPLKNIHFYKAVALLAAQFFHMINLTIISIVNKLGEANYIRSYYGSE